MLPDPLDYMMLKKHADDVGRAASRLFGANSTPPGRELVRALIAKTIGRASGDIAGYATERWGEHAGAIITKAAAMNTIDSDLSPPAAEFFSLALQASVLGKLNLRQVVPGVRMISMTEGSTAYWVGEGKAAPLSYQSIAGSTLRLMKIAALVCATKESLEAAGEVAEAGLQADLQRAVSLGLDQAFVDPANGGSTSMPASVTYDATTIVSAGPSAEALRQDMVQLFDLFAGDLSAAVLIMHPQTALQISLLQQPLGSTSLELTGGTLFGVKVATSRAVPLDSNGAGSITLLDQSAVAMSTGGYDLRQSDQATLEMSDTVPTNATAPTATETTMVSLWQTNTVAFMSTAAANWRFKARIGSSS